MIKLISITQPNIEGLKTAEDLISYCARVSNPSNQLNTETSPRLLKYLITHKHWSPYDMVYMCIEITTSRAKHVGHSVGAAASKVRVEVVASSIDVCISCGRLALRSNKACRSTEPSWRERRQPMQQQQLLPPPSCGHLSILRPKR